MATNKKRKIKSLAEPNNVSAFSGRKLLQVAQIGPGKKREGRYQTKDPPQLSHERQLFSSGSNLAPGISIHRLEGGNGTELGLSSDDDLLEDENIVLKRDKDDGATRTNKGRSSREAQLVTQLTTISLDRGNAEQLEDGSILIRIAPGEKLVILGEYGLSVLRGQITILGAILSPSQVIHDVCASLSHSLPVIRCLSPDPEKSEIRLYQNKSNLRSLKQLSPLFAGLWSTSSHRPESMLWGVKGSTFQILLSQDEVHPPRYHSTVSAPEWNAAISTTVSEWVKTSSPPITMICGPKGSGKSTFSKLLINRLLTTSTPRGYSCIAFLDLDPGQPEFSPPGQLSLHLLSKPNFGPPFSHPDVMENGIKMIRAHSIAAVSPSSDPDFYSTCVADLFSQYLDVLLPMHYPLVINTPGWILGTGLDLLSNLMKLARPTQVIYMSEDGPREAIESLRNEMKPKSVITLPSQPTDNLLRTSADLRTMQYISYFHQDIMNPGQRVWNLNPITYLTPLEVKYAGKTAGILGVICLSEQPSLKMLKDTIDGSIVALIVTEDTSAITSSKKNAFIARYIDDQSREQSIANVNSTSGGVINPFSTAELHRQPDVRLITRSPEGIPYLDLANVVGLDPTHSYTIGLGLIRGIDVRRQRLQMVTPISSDTIQSIVASGKSIFLVSGKLDTPGWAYLETLYKKDADMKEQAKHRETGDGAEESKIGGKEKVSIATDDQILLVKAFESSPWVEILEGDKGRDVGARVWRVRRDLGKVGEGD